MAQIYVAIQDLESWGALEGFMKPSILKTNGRCNNSSMSTQVPVLKSQETTTSRNAQRLPAHNSESISSILSKTHTESCPWECLASL